MLMQYFCIRSLSVIILLSNFCCSQTVLPHSFSQQFPNAQQDNAAPTAAAATSAERTCNASTNIGLQLQFPYTELNIENERNVCILQERQKQQLFVLHGAELHQLLISSEQKQMLPLAKLSGDVSKLEHLGAEIIAWRNYYILVVALEDFLEIYQIPNTGLGQSNDTAAPSAIAPIQQLSLDGKYRKHFLLQPLKQRVMLLVGMNYTKLYAKIRTLEWLETYFDVLEELKVPPMHVLHALHSTPNYLICGKLIKQKAQTALTIYAIQAPSLKLQAVQTLQVQALTVNVGLIRNNNYLLACSKRRQQCITYRMSDGQFNVHKQRQGMHYDFEQFAAAEQYFAGARRNEVVVFSAAQADCYISLTFNESEVSSMHAHAPQPEQTFIVFSYQRPFHTRLRILQVTLQNGNNVLGQATHNALEIDDAAVLEQHRHMFEETIGKLRSLLLKRKAAMDVFHQIPQAAARRLKNIKLKQALQLHAGHIDVINIMGKHLLSPQQLLQRIEQMRATFKHRTRRAAADFSNSVSTTLAKLKVKQLRVRNLLYNGSLLEGFHYEPANAQLSVSLPISTSSLHVDSLLTPASHNYRAARQAAVTSKLKVRQLNVQRINNVTWSEFYEKLYLRNRDTTIVGRLILQAHAQVAHLKTTKLQTHLVHELFNLQQPQIINSNLLISNFFVNDLSAQTVNELDFAEDVVFSGKDALVETAVNFYQMRIAGNLYLENTTDALQQADEQAQLQQYYTGKVIINGSLTVRNLLREHAQETQVRVADALVTEQDLKQNYLLRNEPQFFNRPLVFGNAKVSTTALFTQHLNQQPTADHLLQHAEPATAVHKPLYLVFMQARVEGNMFCRDYNSTIGELHAQAVRYGEVVNITGVKTFAAPLSIDRLMTLQLNELPVQELVLRTQLRQPGLQFSNSKCFERIEVTDVANVAQQLNSTSLNNLQLAELLNYDYQLKSLQVPHKLLSSNIIFHRINDISFDDVFAKFDVADEQLLLHKHVIIEGNVLFQAPVQVHSINNIDWQTYVKSLLHAQTNATLQGPVHFLSQLSITNDLTAQSINNNNLQQIFAHVLSKTKPQTISGLYTFDSLKLTHLDVSYINDINTATLVDMRANKLQFDGDLIVPRLRIIAGNINAKFAADLQLPTLVQKLYALPSSKRWRNIVILGDAQWNTTAAEAVAHKAQQQQLAYLYKNAVRRNVQQIITGNIKLQRPLIVRMRTKAAFPTQIDFDYLAQDCLFKNSSMLQVVRAPKRFLRTLRLHSLAAAAQSNLRVHTLNDIDVLRFNTSLYRRASAMPLFGPLHFNNAPLRIDKLHMQDAHALINGIQLSQLHHLHNTALPPVKLQELYIDTTLQIEQLNDVSLDYLLTNRVTKHGNAALEVFGCLTFEHLVLNKHALLRSINGIAIENLLLKKSQSLQTVNGAKRIKGSLILGGPAHVGQLNDVELMESYQQSVFLSRDYHFDNLELEEATFEGGIVFT